LIVCEGPDGAGKTTLCTRLAKQFEGEVVLKDWGVPRDQMPNVGVKRRVYESLATALRGSAADPVYIHDRLFWSELVYGRVLRGDSAFSRYEYQLMMTVITALKCPVIFCLPLEEVVVENVKASTQLEGVEPMIHEIYDLYARKCTSARHLMGNNAMRYDYTGRVVSTPYEGICERISKYLDRRGERKWGTT